MSYMRSIGSPTLKPPIAYPSKPMAFVVLVARLCTTSAATLACGARLLSTTVSPVGSSMSGMAYLDVVFESSRSLGPGRQAILERVGEVRSKLPAHVRVQVGPTASSTGWFFQYVLVDPSLKEPPQALRRLQLAAEQSYSLAVLFRPLQAGLTPSPAVLRVALPGRESGGLQVRIVKSRGGRPATVHMGH